MGFFGHQIRDLIPRLFSPLVPSPRARLQRRCAAAVAEPTIAEALLKNACEGVPYYHLRPAIGERQFYVLRQLFFITLDERIEE